MLRVTKLRKKSQKYRKKGENKVVGLSNLLCLCNCNEIVERGTSVVAGLATLLLSVLYAITSARSVVNGLQPKGDSFIILLP